MNLSTSTTSMVVYDSITGYTGTRFCIDTITFFPAELKREEPKNKLANTLVGAIIARYFNG